MYQRNFFCYCDTGISVIFIACSIASFVPLFKINLFKFQNFVTGIVNLPFILMNKNNLREINGDIVISMIWFYEWTSQKNLKIPKSNQKPQWPMEKGETTIYKNTTGKTKDRGPQTKMYHWCYCLLHGVSTWRLSWQ